MNRRLFSMGMWFLLILGPAAQPAAGSAQAGPAERVAEGQLAWMRDTLALSSEQAARLATLARAHAAALAAIVADRGDDGGRSAVRLREAREAYEARLRAVLTDAQWRVYADRKDERLAHVLTDVMTLELDLNDAQVPRVLAVNREFVQELPSRPDEGGRRAKRRAARAARDAAGDRQSALRGILTPAQWERFEAGKDRRREQLRALMAQR